MNYDIGQPFVEITFPTRGTSKALFRREDILRVTESKSGTDAPLVTIYTKSIESPASCYGKWYFDGTMDEFKEATKTVYL